MTTNLTEREKEILILLAEGLTARAIGSRINLAPETVRWYLKQVYGKFGVSSRAAAVQHATRLGMIGTPLAATRPSVARSPVRYVTNEGAAIAWQTIGAGPVDLVFMMGFVSHIEAFWGDPGYVEFMETIGRHARVIVFDKRGVGLSDRVQGAASIEDTISDARAVMRAAGSQRAFISGTSESGAAAVLMASIHPELVRGLILVAASPMPARHGPEPEWSRDWDEFERLIAAIKDTWGSAWAVERLAPTRKGDAIFESWWAQTLRAASSPASVELILRQIMQVDVRAILPSVRQRTLVIHKSGDKAVPAEAGRFMATRMPNAHFTELPGHDHVFFVEGLAIAQATVRFLAAPATEPEVDTWLAITLLMAGPEGSFNDEKRSIVDTFAPRAVRTTSQGWVALFDAPNRAIGCAERLQALGRGRTGGMALHVGPCRSSDGAPVGGAHDIAGRLVSLALPGEILVSGTLRDILAGSNVPLVPRALDGGDAFTSPATVWRLERK